MIFYIYGFAEFHYTSRSCLHLAAKHSYFNTSAKRQLNTGSDKVVKQQNQKQYLVSTQTKLYQNVC